MHTGPELRRAGLAGLVWLGAVLAPARLACDLWLQEAGGSHEHMSSSTAAAGIWNWRLALHEISTGGVGESAKAPPGPVVLCVVQPNGIYIAHLAEMPGGYLASTFLVGGPQTPKDPGFGGFSPLRCCSCRRFGLKTTASCRTRKSDSLAIWLQKSVKNPL